MQTNQWSPKALSFGGAMKASSFLARILRSRISRVVATVLLVALVLGGLALSYAHKSVGELLQAVNAKRNNTRPPVQVVAPPLTVETDGSFQYEQWMQMLSRVPTAPNTWHIESKITNDASNVIEVLPMYLYSEVYPNGPETFENSNMICPKSYTHAFSEEVQKGLIVPPEDLGGKIEKVVGLPMDQLDRAPNLGQGGSIAAMVGSRTFAASLAIDAKPVLWGKLSLSPHASVNATWEFESIWAAHRKARFDSAFGIVHLGPLIRSVSATRARSYLVVVRLSCEPKEGRISLKQSSFQLQEISSSLAEDLSKLFPNHRPSVEEFGAAAIKIASER
jgi:hypothetical protein